MLVEWLLTKETCLERRGFGPWPEETTEKAHEEP